jgi:hypothetical protein
MTVALMAEIMKDDDTDMETDVTDPITECKLLGPEDDNNNPKGWFPVSGILRAGGIF